MAKTIAMNMGKQKNTRFKRVLKWTGISLLLLLVLIIIAPFIFKDKIVALVKEEANKSLNAKVDFGEFDLTLFSTFPNFHFTIKNVSVLGVDEFAGDTLASIHELSANINLKSVISGGPYGINSITIDRARILAKVLYDGKANWDITKPSTDTTGKPLPEAEEPAKFSMKLKEFKIIDAHIVYDDQQAHTYARLEKFNYDLTGDFTQDNFVMSNLLDIAKVTVKTGGIAYLNEVHTVLKADLEMDMPAMKFTFKDNEFSLNDLSFGFNGFVQMPDTNINMDMIFKAKQTEFKSILSLIPAVYSKDFASVKTEGKLALDGFVKGTYNSASLPAFALNLVINKAMFKYPSLPKSVNNIEVDLHVNNPNGKPDATEIDLNKFYLEMAGNPIDMKASVRTPVSDPNLKAVVKGLIVLSSVSDFIPMDKEDKLSGTIKTDVSVAGKLSAIENQKYDEFKASGSFEIEQMNYQTPSMPYEVMLNSMKLLFSNQFVELASFDALLGASDIQAKGKIENFMQYLFKNDALKGRFALNSKNMNLNQLMGSSDTPTATAESTTTPAETPTASTGVAVVPSNIDFVLDAKLDKVIFQNMMIDNLVGNIAVRNSRAEMNNLRMNTLGGALAMSGFYETTNPKKPTTGLNLKVENFDIQNTFKTFNTVQKIAPAAEYAKGVFSASLENFNVSMNENMDPDLNSVKAFGYFKTNKVVVGGFPPFVKLGEALKLEQLKTTEVNNLMLNYKLENGRLVLAPFDTKINNINTNISGSTGFDQTIDYKWRMEIPKAMLGGPANEVISGMLNKLNSQTGTNVQMGDKVNVHVLFGGTVTKPVVSTSLKEEAKSIVSTVTTAVVNTAIDKANEEIQKILDEAQAKCDKMKAETAAEVEKTKQEGYAAADKIVEDETNPLKKMAAKKLAEEAKKKVDAKCQKMIEDSDNRCKKTLEEAKVKADAKAEENKK